MKKLTDKVFVEDADDILLEIPIPVGNEVQTKRFLLRGKPEHLLIVTENYFPYIDLIWIYQHLGYGIVGRIQTVQEVLEATQDPKLQSFLIQNLNVFQRPGRYEGTYVLSRV